MNEQFGRARSTLITVAVITASIASSRAATTTIAAAPEGGFWVQVLGEETRAVDGAPKFPFKPPGFTAGVIAAIPGHNGYWIVYGGGRIDNYGEAPPLCSGNLTTCSKYKATYAIVSAAASPDGQGLWVLDSNGAVWTAGTAQSYGDVTKDKNGKSKIVATTSGKGYYIVLSDGGVYSFGDAEFFGSLGGKGNGIAGMTLSLNAAGQVNGYWLIDRIGNVYSFGKAIFLGSTGGNRNGSDVADITTLPNGRGYVWVHDNGTIEQSKIFPRVMITSQETGRNIDIAENSTESGARLVQADPTDNLSQKWDMFPTATAGIVQLVNVNSRMCMNVSGSTYHEVIQYPCMGGDNELWQITGPDSATQLVPQSDPTFWLFVIPPNGITLVFKANCCSGATWSLTHPKSPPKYLDVRQELSGDSPQ